MPGHGSWHQNYCLLHKALALEEAFQQGSWCHWMKETVGQLGEDYGGGGDGAESGGHAAENSLCEGVLMHDDSVKILHMENVVDSMMVTLA